MEVLELGPSRPITRRELGWAVLLTGVVAWLYVLVFKIDFSGPLFGFSDTPIWYMAGDFFRTNLHWWPWPHLEPMTERYMYPYGPTVGLYQPFALERDILVSLAIRVGGVGPWVQVYFVGSLSVTLLGGYLIMRQGYARLGSAAVALLVAFGNAFVLDRYPVQIGPGVASWLLLMILLDHVMLRQLWCERRVVVRLVGVRFLLAGLAVGLELGYYTGFSFMINLAALLGWAVCLQARRGEWGGLWADVRAQMRLQWKFLTGVVVVVGLLAALYCPLILQIRATLEYYGPLDSHNMMHYNPLRPLWPLWLGDGYLEDEAEASVDLRPGLGLLVLALVGAGFTARRQWRVGLPALLVLGFVLSYVSGCWRWLPWFAHARISTRFGVALVPLLAPWAVWGAVALWQRRQRLERLGLIFLVLVVGFETSYLWYYRVGRARTAVIPREGLEFYAQIARTPGTAVMEWPFIVYGGNSVRFQGSSRYFEYLAGSFGMGAVYGKATNSIYLGRLQEKQIAAMAADGWGPLLQRAPKPLKEAELEKLVAHFRGHDFAGMLLYETRIGPEQTQQILAALGPATMVHDNPVFGRVWWIARREEGRVKR